jgi:C-terminal processing protease CtpA/Prc
MGLFVASARLLLLLLPLALLGSCNYVSSGLQSPASASYADQFDFLWQKFDQNYSYFVYKNIDWSALRDTYRPMALQATSQDQFTQVLVAMLANLHDLHVYLVDPAGNQTPTFVPTSFVNFNSTVWQQYLQAQGTGIQQNSLFTTGQLKGAAYIAINSWAPSSGSEAADLDTALQQFQNAPGLIVDVRMNGGGDGATAASFAGRFADQTRVGGYDQFRDGPSHSDFGPLLSRPVSPRGPWQFRAPVLLLIGRGCYSSNEDFIAMMRELPNVTVAGDTSGGHSGYPVLFNLSNNWQFTVSTWIDYTAEKQVIEDQGINPGVFVPATAADFQAGNDPVLDYAIAHIPH